MSGGSLDYVYSQVEYAAEQMKTSTPLHRAFRSHLFDVAQALHDIEWVESGDYGEGDDVEAMRVVLSPTKELEHLMKEAKGFVEVIEQAIERAETEDE